MGLKENCNERPNARSSLSYVGYVRLDVFDLAAERAGKSEPDMGATGCLTLTHAKNRTVGIPIHVFFYSTLAVKCAVGTKAETLKF